jgi:hypothetical protein
MKREAGIHADEVHNKIIRNYICGLSKHLWLNADNLLFAVTTNTELSQRLFFIIIIMNTKPEHYAFSDPLQHVSAVCFDYQVWLKITQTERRTKADTSLSQYQMTPDLKL